MVSKRSQIFLEREEFLVAKMSQCAQDLFDANMNPKGYVNLGTAQNFLCEQEIAEWLKVPGNFEHKSGWQHYTALEGHVSVRNSVAKFLSEKLSTSELIDPNHLRILKGVTVCIEALGFALFEHGDVVITPTPTYARFFADFEERAGVKLQGLQLSESDNFLLTAQKLEEMILKQMKLGNSVKGFLFCNPSNPLGEVYPIDLTQKLMKVCAQYKIHFISDEVYALSVYDKDTAFKSILSLPTIFDPERTHFMWGMSKDLGIAGFRFGVIHTRNQDVLKVLSGMSIYTAVPAHIQELGGKMLSDRTWLNEIYFPRNIQRLGNNYARFKSFLETKHQIQVRKASAGFFIWVNFSKFLPKNKTAEDEINLFNILLEKFKLYIIPGSQMASNDPGWFRIVIAVKQEQLEVFEKRFDEFANSFVG